MASTLLGQTDSGRELLEQGREQGREQGQAKTQAATARILLQRRFGSELPADRLEEIVADLVAMPLEAMIVSIQTATASDLLTGTITKGS